MKCRIFTFMEMVSQSSCTGGLNKMGTSTPKLQNDDNQQPRGVRIPYSILMLLK